MRGTRLETPLTRHAGIEVPLICGAMYPCSNPELVAAVSEAGGIGIVQPLSLTFVHGHEFRAGLRMIRSLTSRPIGMNALIEKSSSVYMDRMRRWVHEAIEEGVRFFVTSLGNPRWVADLAHAVGGVVYHDVTEARWAARGADGGVDGLIAVNARAGGHAGPREPQALLEELHPFGLPVVAAGGIGDPAGFAAMLRLGYAGVQMGTRFIATIECRASDAYKQAIVAASESDVVLTERLTGVPVAVLNTPHVQRVGTKAGSFERWMLRGRRRKHWMRSWYTVRSGFRLKHDSLATNGRPDYWQAGKSVAVIHSIQPAGNIVRACAAAISDGRPEGSAPS
jgi:nitronate monooxygenase